MPRKPKLPAVPLPPSPPPAPEPPNPVVLALQEQILGLVNQRAKLQAEVRGAEGNIVEAQMGLKWAQQHLQDLETEVRYRLGLINELLGKPAQINVGLDSRSFTVSEGTIDIPFMGTALPAGVGSIPPRRAPIGGVVGEARTESAEDERRAL